MQYILVDMHFNAYQQHLSIRIDNKMLSEYSELLRYLDRPFYEWCGKISDTISKELEDREFLIKFTGPEFEARILKTNAKACKTCRGFKYCRPSNYKDAPVVVKELSDMIRDNRIGDLCGNVPITIGHSHTEPLPDGIESLFAISCNFFKPQLSDNGDYLFYFTDRSTEPDYISAGRYKVCFVFIRSDKNDISVMKENMIAFEWDGTLLSLHKTVNGCIITAPLTQSIKNAAEHIMRSDERLCTRVEELCSDTAVVHVKMDGQIECGRSAKVEFIVHPEGVPCPKITCKFDRENIASFDGIYLHGLNPGTVTVSFFADNDLKAFHKQKVEFIKRTRITELTLSEHSMVLQAQTNSRIDFDFAPTNADNLDEVHFFSSDKEIVFVDEQGRLRAVSEGKAIIYIKAENVSDMCAVTVMPRLAAIRFWEKTLLNQRLTMLLFERLSLDYSCYPENAYEKTLQFHSENSSVVTIEGGYLCARGIGSTVVTAEHMYEGVIKRWNISVIENTPPTPSPKKKKGLISRLF